LFFPKTESSVVQLYLIVSDQQSVMNTLKEIKRVTPVPIKDSAEGSDTPSQEEIYTLTQKATFRGDLKPSEGGVPVKNSDPDPTPVPVFDPKAIQEIVKNTVAETVASVKQAMESEKQSALEAQKQQFETAKATLEASLNSAAEAIQKSNEKIAQLETKVTESEKTINNFADLGKLYGSQTPEKMQLPNFNKTVAHDADKITGALDETFNLIEDIQKNSGVIYSAPVMGGNQTVNLYDKVRLDRHVKNNRQQIVDSLDDWGRKQGWFRGTRSAPVMGGQVSKNSPTTAADLPPFFLDTLSAILRTTQIPGFAFWQIPNYTLDFTARNGTVIRIPRLNYLTSSPSVSDYQLSGKGEYADLTSESDNNSASSVSAEIFEYGRGKVGASTAIRPVSIPTFTEYFSAMGMIDWMQNTLYFDYASFDNTMIKTMLDSTSLHLYNKKGSLVTSPTGLSATGDDGTFTKGFLRRLYQYAHDNKFQMYPDQTYLLFLNSTQILQLKESYDDDWQANTTRDLDALLNILNPSYIPPGDTGRVSSYLGLVEKFHIFETGNSVGVGAAGQPGVQSETLGGSLGAKTTRTGYLIGAGALGVGVGMPFQITFDNVTQFDRRIRATWLAWLGYKTLDVDPIGTGEASQQLRVAELRTLDVAV
jgi:hypothetical protein